MSIEYKVYDNNMLLLKKYKKPLQWIGEGNDWRVEQIINGEVEKIWDGGWSKAYAEKTKKYLERSAGLEFFDLQKLTGGFAPSTRRDEMTKKEQEG